MRRKGFTLVELLATIVILGILLIIAVPKISNVIDNAQKGAYKSTNSVIVSELRRQNGLEITPLVYTFTDGVMSPDVGITGELPKNGTVEVNSLGQIQIVTSNDKYCAIKRFDEDNVAIFDAGERNCNVVVEITLTVNPNGGTYEGSTSNTTYSIPTEDFQTINDPTRAGYTFDGWTLEGEGTYSSWLFQAGYTDATLTAKWLLSPTLTVNANGGTWSGTTPQIMVSGNTATINNPTRTNYTFTGWTVSGAGSSMSGTTFTMGTANTTLIANWVLTTYTLTVNANGGTWSGTTPQTIAIGGTTTIANPTRSGYLFTGWTVSGTGSSLSETIFTMGTANTTLTANWLAYTSMYTYTGSSTVIDDGNGNWRIKFLTSGTFTPVINMSIDAFLVGGGGGGGSGDWSAGGGGGYVSNNTNIALQNGTGYSIIVGAGGASDNIGGTTSSFGASASGGYPGTPNIASQYGEPGGNGGSGGGGYENGSGGSDGSNGGTHTSAGGIGQGITTREFLEATGDLYAGGGGAYGANGGAGGGGRGVTGTTPSSRSGIANTGGGGGASYNGGSGIVVIRNTKVFEVGNTVKYKFSYSGIFEIIDKNTDNWKIKFLTSGKFTPLVNMKIDAFLVGGGGGGGQKGLNGGGGGGGYTKTQLDVSLSSSVGYFITIGQGGTIRVNGKTTSIATLGISVGGGSGSTDTGGTGGNGGSGGGGNSTTGIGASGGSNGSNGAYGAQAGGIGQGTTTREFGESTGTLYAGGGGGVSQAGPYSAGGAGGGGNGANNSNGGGGSNGTPNTGGGGGFNCSGGSGIVVIRAS